MTNNNHSITPDLNDKNHSNELLIEDGLDDDNSVVRLSSDTMNRLELFCGDTVKLKGKKRRETICIVLDDDTCQDNCIRINQLVQDNLRVYPGDTISIDGYQHLQYGTSIHVLPIEDTIKNIDGSPFQEYLQPYFANSYRPVHIGDTFIVRVKTCAIEFKVMHTDPSPYCIVAPETIINCEGEPITRDIEEEVTFDDIVGLEDIKRELKVLVQFPLEHERLYSKFGLTPTRGVLLYGPSGCGKTMLAKAIASECDMKCISINARELLSMLFADINKDLSMAFDKARSIAPCVLIIDEIDYMHYSDLSIDRFLNQFLTEIDGLNMRTKVFIIGTTNRPDIVDRTILRPGRLDQMIYVPPPNEKAREAILKNMLRKWRIANDVDLTHLAKVLQGYSGASITELCRKACNTAIRESIEKQENLSSTYSNTSNVVDEIRREHFDKAIILDRCLPISNIDIRKYEMFAQGHHLSYTFNSPFLTFNFPEYTNTNSYIEQNSNRYTDDDDLYG